MDTFESLVSEMDHDVRGDAPHTREHHHDAPGRLTSAEQIHKFALAGKATLTLRSVGTGSRFTYRITASDDGAVHFVSVLTDFDNENGYTYLGIIRRGVFMRTGKSRIGIDAPSHKAFAWAWRMFASGRVPESLEVWHEGRCGRCGRKLIVPESIASGIGPECASKMGLN